MDDGQCEYVCQPERQQIEFPLPPTFDVKSITNIIHHRDIANTTLYSIVVWN